MPQVCLHINFLGARVKHIEVDIIIIIIII